VFLQIAQLRGIAFTLLGARLTPRATHHHPTTAAGL
jgi:hypothetical protein